MYLYVDIETTCWEKKYKKDLNEIIEIGVVLAKPDRSIIDQYQAFIKPSINYELSLFCKRLTGIRQEWIDKSNNFAYVISDLRKWVKHYSENSIEKMMWMSWGSFDKKAFIEESHRYSIPYAFGPHVDFQDIYGKLRNCGRVSVKKAMDREGVAMEGDAHRAIWDAVNIANLGKKVL